MKLHITKKAIKLIALEYQTARDIAVRSSGANHEYWLGKQVAISDTFAYATGQSYNEACMFLEAVKVE